jgi:hypothetical protein
LQRALPQAEIKSDTNGNSITAFPICILTAEKLAILHQGKIELHLVNNFFLELLFIRSNNLISEGVKIRFSIAAYCQ